MEQNQLDRETFSCSICLDLLKDPVTIPCGHSYCMNCINNFWDEEDQKGIHSCPQCRKTFIPRPVLEKSAILAALVEQLKKTGLQAAPADLCYAGPEDVACDFCSGRKLKAIKSCLICLASFCEKHLQPHYDVAPLKKHKLLEPSKNLQENICSRHDEVMKMFCRKDQKCICYLCLMGEHKGHDTVSAAAERTEKQRELEVRRENIQQRIQDREKDVKEQKEKVVFINRSADKSVKACEKIFIELIRLIQRRSSDVKRLIRTKQETDVNEAKENLNKLEQEIAELKRKDGELKQLSNTEDDILFLKNYYPEPSLTPKMLELKLPNLYKVGYLNDIKTAVLEAERVVEEIVTSWMEITLTEIEIDGSSSTPAEVRMNRKELLVHLQDLTLDSVTSNRYLSVTKNRAIKNEKAQCADSSERFKRFQALSKTTLSGSSYWEVSKSGRCSVAVVSKDISKTGRPKEYTFGLNKDSWALECCQLFYIFRHDNALTLISGPGSSRVGVYLDHRAGILSFYSVSETMTLLHRVQTTFTQPLHAGIQLYENGDSAEFCGHI
ncbi:tripartite motif-containing protein 16-like [Fundulus heteroclitus]|uniref:tripartite motif-containing protein 16-like n=1 Tax=Fundulus heteroclitus TaxID=8078 RepID=UPI00165AB845|nr:tripartite motif-containing protein 16-like [Fundulus heteroclitus]